MTDDDDVQRDRTATGSRWPRGASTSDATAVAPLGGRPSSVDIDGPTGSTDDAPTGGPRAGDRGDAGNRSGSGSGGQGEADQDLADTAAER